MLIFIVTASRHGSAMRLSRSFLVLAIFLIARDERVDAEPDNSIWKGFSVTCMNDEKELSGNVSCHGIRIVRRIIQNLLEEAKKKKSMEIFDGVSLVESKDEDYSARGARVLSSYGQMGSLVKFLQNRELKIKLNYFLPENIESIIEDSLPSSTVQGRGKKGDKGDKTVMVMGFMMYKMVTAMGMGALALMSMKGLMVSALALMLSLIVAAKKLAGGKEEEGHHIVYAQEIGHHRRRRSFDTNSFENFENHPYKAYALVNRYQKSR